MWNKFSSWFTRSYLIEVLPLAQLSRVADASIIMKPEAAKKIA